MSTLKNGMSGSDVKNLQQALSAQGYPVKIDGKFGPETVKALQAFQRSANIRPDGAYGQRSAGILQPPLPRPDPSRQFPPMQPSMNGGGSGGAQATAQMQMVPQQPMPQAPPPGIGSDPDRNVTSGVDPGFPAYNQGMLAAGQSNAARPPMPMDGSALQTANSPMADGGPMAQPPQQRPQPSPDQFTAARAQLQQQMQPPQQAVPTPPTPEQMAAARQSLQQQLQPQQPQQAPQPPQAGFQMPSFMGQAQAAEPVPPEKRIVRFQGKTLSFPATATDEQIAQVLSTRSTQPGNGQDGSLSVDNAVRATARGVPAIGSFLDEANAATNATLAPIVEPFMSRGPNDISQDGASWGERYNRSLEMQRNKDKAFDDQNPVTSTGLQIAGGVASGGALLKAAPGAAKVALGMGGKSLPGQIGSSLLSGGALGTASGFGEGEGGLENRAASAGTGMALGASVGAAAPVIGKVVGKTVGKILQKDDTPTTEMLKTAGNKAFKAAEDAGLVVSPSSFKGFADRITAKVAARGIDPGLHPDAISVMKRIKTATDTPAPLTLQDINILRQLANDAVGSQKPSEQALGKIIRTEIDDYVGGLKPSDILAGDHKTASEQILRGRSLWSKMKKSKALDDMEMAAQNNASVNYSSAGYETAIRRQFKQLANNPDVMKTFTPDERAAILRVVRGSGLTGSALRLVGKLATRGPVSGGLNLGVAATMGPAAGFASAAAGELAKAGSDALTRRNVKMASELIRRGAPAPKPGSPLAEAYARLLTQIGGQEAVQMMPQRSMP